MSHIESVGMVNLISAISKFDLKTINITWDTLQILSTIAIYLTLVIFIWLTRIDPCSDKMIHDIRDIQSGPHTDIPQCLAGSRV